jgi:hypothetical protein
MAIRFMRVPASQYQRRPAGPIGYLFYRPANFRTSPIPAVLPIFPDLSLGLGQVASAIVPFARRSAAGTIPLDEVKSQLLF